MTMKYKFILEDTSSKEDFDYGPSRHIEHVITGEQTWPQLLEHIQFWMKGCGYVFDGELDIVDPDTGISAKEHLYKND